MMKRYETTLNAKLWQVLLSFCTEAVNLDKFGLQSGNMKFNIQNEKYKIIRLIILVIYT